MASYHHNCPSNLQRVSHHRCCCAPNLWHPTTAAVFPIHHFALPLSPPLACSTVSIPLTCAAAFPTQSLILDHSYNVTASSFSCIPVHHVTSPSPCHVQLSFTTSPTGSYAACPAAYKVLLKEIQYIADYEFHQLATQSMSISGENQESFNQLLPYGHSQKTLST